MERGKMPSTGRGGKSKTPQHPQDIFALGSKSTVVVSRDPEKRSIHKPSTSGVERKRETSAFGSQPPSKRSRIGSPAEAVGGTSLEVDPVDLVPNVLQALDTHNSDKLLGLLTGSIRLLKSQRSKPDPILCMSLLYLTKIRPNMFAHDTVTQVLCTLLKREQGAAFKNKGNPLVFVLACNMLYAGHRESSNWPEIFIKVYIEDALNERCWVECSWCKCFVENVVTAFSTKQPPSHLIPSDNTLGTMSPSGSGSPLMGSTDDDPDNMELEYSVFPRYSSSYEAVEALVLEAVREQIQRRSAAPDAFGKGFLKLLSATCGIPEVRALAAPRLEAWLHSGKLWRCAQELLAHVCCNLDGAAAARDQETMAQLARMRLKTKPLQAAYQACLREMVSESPALLRSVVTHTIYNELSNVRSPNNMAVLAALIQAQPLHVPAAMADTYQELVLRPEDYLRPLRALTREVIRAARADAQALLPLARALAAPPPHEPAAEVRERAFSSLAELFCCCCLVAAAAGGRGGGAGAGAVAALQAAALGWLLDCAAPLFRPTRHDYQLALNKIMFVEPAETYSKVDNWPPESERALIYRVCCEAPLPQNTLLRVIFIGLSKELPVSPAEVFELVEQLVRRACALPPEDSPLQVDKLEVADYLFQLCQFTPPDNITLPPGYTAPPLAIASLYWRGWLLLAMLAAHNPQQFAERAAQQYPTLRALIEMCITNKPSIEWTTNSAAEAERAEAEKAAILQLETHLAAASNSKLPITEHSSRLLSQLTTLEPLGPARKPPQAIIDTLQTLSAQMRLGKLLCRQPALLLELVERHGTRRAMPWLHQLLRHDQLELSVLPVQCLCEFLSAGGVGEAGKAGELCAHLRRTVADSEEGARAVLHYYLQRLEHAHAPTRASASRGLKLVLSQSTDDTAEMDYNADVNPEEWLELVRGLRHWAAVRGEVVARVRRACLAECVPRHLAAYIAFLAKCVAAEPLASHADIALDLSQVLMERTTVMGNVLGTGERLEPHELGELQREQHRALHALTTIMHAHLQHVRANPAAEEGAGGGAGAGGERVTLVWPSGRSATLHVLLAQAHLKLLCYGPSIYDTNQEMYSWLQSVWVGNDAPQAFNADSTESAALLPDWLRLHMVRSARPALLEAGMRALPAHKLALFIQTFGMPVASMSALLGALDACPAGAVVRLGVERGYMAQLLRVQRARGATGGAAFAAALRLQPPQYPPDDTLFTEESLPEEADGEWGGVAAPPPLQPELVPALLATAFAGAATFHGDLDTAFTQLISLVTGEVSRIKSGGGGPAPYVQCVAGLLRDAAASPALAAGLLRAPARAAPLLRAALPLAAPPLPEVCSHHYTTLLRDAAASPALAAGLLRAPARAAPLLRAALPLAAPPLPEVCSHHYTTLLRDAAASPALAAGLLRAPARAAPLLRAALPLAAPPLPEVCSHHYTTLLRDAAASPALAAGLLRAPARAAPLLRAALPLAAPPLPELAEALLVQFKCVSGPVVQVLRALAAPRGAPVKRELHAPHVPHQATKDQLVALLESASPNTLEAIGNRVIATQDTRVIVDVITQILENNQDGRYETSVKSEDGSEGTAHVFSRRGLGVGLLLDWMSELQRETLGLHHQRQRQMQLMFRAGCAAWRPLLVTLLAHRASWRTLHAALATLLQPDGCWSASAVLDFAETLVRSPRVWQGRDKTTPKHHAPDDTLRLDHRQLGVVVRYVVQEGLQAARAGGAEAMRRRMEARLPLALRCCSAPPALLALALAAQREHPLLLLLLYMKVPKILQLVSRSGARAGGRAAPRWGGAERAAAALSTSAADQVSHTLLTALPAHHPHHSHSKEHNQKIWRMEADIRSVWARVEGAGARALALAGALVRGSLAAHQRHHAHLLAALEVLPDADLFAPGACEEVHGILECLLSLVRQTSGGGGGGGAISLAHRVAALLRRYLACRPQPAAALLHAHKDTIASVPALSSLQTAEVAAPASAAPPPHALLALQRRSDTPDTLLWMLQEVDAWGSRRGGAWGGAAAAAALLRAAAPLAAHAHRPLRAAALALLAKLLPAVPDTRPGLLAILECLESSQPEVTQSVLDKLPELVVGMQEHAARLLARVFELGVTSRYPVETCLAKCVTTINLHRGC